MKKLLFIELNTERLRLRKFAKTDSQKVIELAGAFEIADTTLRIPHPYHEKDATKWIQKQLEKSNQTEEITWAITLNNTRDLIDTIGLMNFN
jgi:RimJ/RimL family protein N-acetyltransferase